MTDFSIQNLIEFHRKKYPIKFSDDGHTYKLNGKLLTGVTTVLDVRAKDFLKWWTVKEMYLYLQKNWDIERDYTKKEKEELLLEGKKAHTKKSKGALKTGKIVHQWIEKHIRGEEVFFPDEDAVKYCIGAFLTWERENKVEWLASELVVVSPLHSFAGTLDALASVNGELALLDFKTSSQMSEEYFLQTAGYQICLEEMGIVPKHRIVLRVPKDGSSFEVLTVKTDVEFDKRAFLNLREAHRWNIYINNNFKNESGKLISK